MIVGVGVMDGKVVMEMYCFDSKDVHCTSVMDSFAPREANGHRLCMPCGVSLLMVSECIGASHNTCAFKDPP